jgi:hypothetical protein
LLKSIVFQVWQAARLAVGIGALALAGCAAFEQRSDEEVIRERALARWELFIKGDIRGAYEYLSPGARQTVTASQYMGSIKPGLWRTARVDKVNCVAPDMCEVDLTIGIVFAGRASHTPLREKWVRVDSKWWYFYER